MNVRKTSRVISVRFYSQEYKSVRDLTNAINAVPVLAGTRVSVSDVVRGVVLAACESKGIDGKIADVLRRIEKR
jgi:hypothetical protein